MDKTNTNAFVQSIEHSLHLIHENQFSIKQYHFQKNWPEFYATWFREPHSTAPICVRRRLRL